MTPIDPFRDLVIELLGHEPITEGELSDRLLADPDYEGSAGDVSNRLARLLQLDTSIVPTSAGLVHIPTLVDGTRWTVRVDSDDLEQGFLRIKPDLAVLSWWLVDGAVPMRSSDGRWSSIAKTDGLILDDADTDVLFIEEGWIDPSTDWIEVRVADGELVVAALDSPPDPTDAQIQALMSGFERDVAYRSESPLLPGAERFASSSPGAALTEAIVVDRTAFVASPCPPLAALVDAAGLDHRGHDLAETGFDWASYDDWRAANRFELSYDLDRAGAEKLVRLSAAIEGRLPDVEAVEIAVDALDDGAVAEAFWEEIDFGYSFDDAFMFVDRAIEIVGEPLPVGLGWVRARMLDLEGSAVAAIEMLEGLVDDNCTHDPTLIDLAGYCSDRGDARGAVRLLRRTDALMKEPRPDVLGLLPPNRAKLLFDEVDYVANYRPKPIARRNDPCPCGSGRKYKACHLRSGELPPHDRAVWLFGKLVRFVRQRYAMLIDDLARQYAYAAEDYALSRVLTASPFTADLALHECGVIDEFLRDRDGIVPDDDLMLATQWAAVDRGVFEVTATTTDEVELHNIGTGDDILIVHVDGDDVRVGALLVGRPLPVDGVYRALSGFLPATPTDVRTTIEVLESVDAFALVDHLGSAQAPPGHSNTDGEMMVMHTIRWRVGEPSAVDAALVNAGLERDPEDGWTLVRDGTVLAWLSLDDDLLTGDVNSDERAEHLRSLVEAALDAELIDDHARSLDEVAADLGIEVGGDQPDIDLDDDIDLDADIDLDDEERARIVGEFIERHERGWLDESIPALGGRTPREAADDPVGREELRRLLVSFPEVDLDDFEQMSAARLAKALDIELGPSP